MLKYLERRATALKAANHKKAQEIEKEMTEYKNKDENFNKIMRPNCAYVTFRNDTAFQKVLELAEKHSDQEPVKYREEKLHIKRANYPTNIQWENFEFTKNQRKVRWAASISCILISGCLYFLLAAYALQL